MMGKRISNMQGTFCTSTLLVVLCVHEQTSQANARRLESLKPCQPRRACLLAFTKDCSCMFEHYHSTPTK